MPHRRKIIIGLLALAVCGVLAVVFWPEKPEPVYKSRRLSEWVITGPKPEMAFREAVEAVGTNGIPFYLEWIRYRPSSLTRTKFRLAEKIRQWLNIKWYPNQSETARDVGAHSALRVLGARAEVAIPQLSFYATNPVWDASSRSLPLASDSVDAIYTLACLGNRAAPGIISLMTNEHARIRLLAVDASRKFYGNTSVVAQLERSTQDPDAQVMRLAISVLKQHEKNFHSPKDKL
jgi:hypothetical protein